jgi:SAM-dependent methyltransferase
MVLFSSIEYWPDPQRGIKEAYRVVKPGGVACLIGPVHPTFWLSRFFADMWMLFPTEEEYIEWFTKAGFEDVKLKRIGPKWYRGVRRHGLIMGCSVTGVKRASGDSPLQVRLALRLCFSLSRCSKCVDLSLIHCYICCCCSSVPRQRMSRNP